MMRGVGPDLFTLRSAVGLLIAVVGAALVLVVMTRLTTAADTARHRRLVGMGVAVASVSTLGFGWLVIAVPALEGFLGGDWRAYHTVIAELSDGILGGAQPSRWPNRAAFFYAMAIPHRLLGSSGLMTVAVNAAMVGTMVLLIADIAGLLFDRRSAVAAALLVATIPAVPLWSGMPLREAMANLLLVAIANLGARIAVGLLERPWELIGLVATGLVVTVVAYRTRSELGIVTVLLLATALLLRVRRWPVSQRLLSASLGRPAVALLAALLVAAVAERAYRWLDAFAVRAQVSFFNLHRGSTSAIGPQPELTPTSPVTLLLDGPAAIVRALWGPPPGAMLRVQPLFVAEAAVWWVLTPLLVIGAIEVVRRRQAAVLVLVVPALTWAALSGWTLGNWGIVSRMRLSSWLLLLPIVALGAVRVIDRWRTRREDAQSVASEHGEQVPTTT